LRYIFDPENEKKDLQEIIMGRTERIKAYFREIWLPLDSPAGMINQGIREHIYKLEEEGFGELQGQIWHFDVCSNAREVKGHSYHESGLLVGWKALAAPLVSPLMDVDLSTMRLSFLSMKSIPSGQPFFAVDSVGCKSRVREVSVSSSGKVVEVEAGVHQDGNLALTMIARFLFPSDFDPRGTFLEWSKSRLLNRFH
jgi:hypothetical protein